MYDNNNFAVSYVQFEQHVSALGKTHVRHYTNTCRTNPGTGLPLHETGSDCNVCCENRKWSDKIR